MPLSAKQLSEMRQRVEAMDQGPRPIFTRKEDVAVLRALLEEVERLHGAVRTLTRERAAFQADAAHREMDAKDARRRLEDAVAARARLQQALDDYGQHRSSCILTRWEAGEPTPDGGYRTKYAGVWYDVKTPPACQCGFTAALGREEDA